jgi:hypothetical protein
MKMQANIWQDHQHPVSLGNYKLFELPLYINVLEWPKCRTLTRTKAGEMENNRNFHSLLMGRQNQKILWNNLVFSYKAKHILTFNPAILLLGINLKTLKNLHMNVYGCFICNCHNIKVPNLQWVSGLKKKKIGTSREWTVILQ